MCIITTMGENLVLFGNQAMDHGVSNSRVRCLVCGKYQMFEEFDVFLYHVYKCGGKVMDYV